MQRNQYDPQLPTPEQAAQGLKKSEIPFLSNHLPLSTEVNTSGGSLRLVTWNAMDNAHVGFGVHESDPAKERRQSKCLEAVNRFIVMHESRRIAIDAILLQEWNFVTHEKLEKTLENTGYNYVSDAKGRIIIYNARTLKWVSTSLPRNDIPEKYSEMVQRTQQEKFIFLRNNSVLVIKNVAFSFHNPLSLFEIGSIEDVEKYIESLIEAEKGSSDVVVGGNFGYSYLSSSHQDSSIITSVHYLDLFKRQFCGFTEGFFVKTPFGQFHNTQIHVLDVSTGLMFLERRDLELKNFVEDLQKTLLQQRAVLSCCYPVQWLLGDTSATLLAKHKIQVRHTANAFRQTKLAVTFVKNHDHSLQDNGSLIKFLYQDFSKSSPVTINMPYSPLSFSSSSSVASGQQIERQILLDSHIDEDGIYSAIALYVPLPRFRKAMIAYADHVITAFKEIYNALTRGQSTLSSKLLHRNFARKLEGLPSLDAIKLIWTCEDTDERKEEAWSLVEKHHQDFSRNNLALLSEIYKFSRAHSGFFGNSSSQVASVLSSGEISTLSQDAKATALKDVTEAADSTRTGKIRNALRKG